MKLLDTIRKQLDSVEATNASKIYTPFTLFCIFFAIYFNADILGSIFLSTKWETKSAALKLLADRSWDIWFLFSFRVISYSLGMLILYGLAQAGAAFVWGLSNWANTALSAYANRSKFIAKSEFENVLQEANTLRQHEKELYEKIGEYHNWKPKDIDRLNSELASSKDSYGALLSKRNENEDKLLKLKRENALLHGEQLKKDADILHFLDQINKEQNTICFYQGYSKFLSDTKTEKFTNLNNLPDDDDGLFFAFVKSYDVLEVMRILSDSPTTKVSLDDKLNLKTGIAVGILVHLKWARLNIKFDELDVSETEINLVVTLDQGMNISEGLQSYEALEKEIKNKYKKDVVHI